MRIQLRQVVEPHPALRNNLLMVGTICDVLAGHTSPVGTDLDAEIPAEWAGILWMYAYVHACGTISELPLLAAIRVYRTELRDYSKQCIAALVENPDADLAPCLLGIANREVLSLSTAPHRYDLRYGQDTTNRPTVFEGISYNLAYPLKLEWLRLREQQNAESAMQRNS